MPMNATGGAVISLSLLLAAAAVGLVHAVALVGWVHDPARASSAAPPGADRGAGDDRHRRAPGRTAGNAAPAQRLQCLHGRHARQRRAARRFPSPSRWAASIAAAGPYSVLVTLAFFGTAACSTMAPGLARLVRSSPPAGAQAVHDTGGRRGLNGIAALSFALAAVAYVLMAAQPTRQSARRPHAPAVLVGPAGHDSSVPAADLAAVGVVAGLFAGGARGACRSSLPSESLPCSRRVPRPSSAVEPAHAQLQGPQAMST